MNINKPIVYKANNLLSLNFIDHGFFTRNGGVSAGDFTSLNTSYHTEDNKEHININRSIIVKYFKNKYYKLVTLKQKSQDKIVVITKNNIPDYNTEGDALITNVSGIILGVHAADCVPILLADPKTKFIAAIHAGYNGAFLGIVEKTINTLLSIGVNSKNLIAALGPSIKQESYEVKDDFYKTFLEQNLDNKQFFLYNKSKNCYFFSLQNYIIKKLSTLQLKNIEELPFNTYNYPELFFSHRFSKKINKDRGLQISTIVIKE